MIPAFPEFKKLELSDREAIDAYTAQFPLYSDFEFGSVWSWDVKEEMRLSLLNDNLVIRFTDYITGEPFFTFLGTTQVTDTALALIKHATASGEAIPELRIIPEVSASGLDRTLFTIEESRDHFDYVCEVARHIDYADTELQSHRKLLRQFTETYPQFEEIALDMTVPKVQKEIAEVYQRWDKNKGFLTSSEAFAYERFLLATPSFAYTAVGIRIDGALVAFHVTSLPAGTCANALFSKADTAYRGVYAALDYVVARDLLVRGYTHMNIQQDLGIESLRAAKQSLDPAYFLKKYTVRLATS